jgi:hypothetical protein
LTKSLNVFGVSLDLKVENG